MEAYEQWRGWAEKAAADYCFHVAITWWDDSVHDDMGTLVQRARRQQLQALHGLQERHHGDDETLVNSFSPRARARRACRPCTPRTASSSSSCRRRCSRRGITGPEGHPLSRPPEVEGEAANRAIRIADVLGAPLYIVHVSCTRVARGDHARAQRRPARLRRSAGRPPADRRIGLPQPGLDTSPPRT